MIETFDSFCDDDHEAGPCSPAIIEIMISLLLLRANALSDLL